MNNKTGFKDKYNFNIIEQEKNFNELMAKFNPFKRYEFNLPILTHYRNLEYTMIQKPLSFEDKIAIKKVQYDSMTESEILKKKVILNYKLLQIFFDNFYSDDFNKTRMSVYILFTFPFLVGGGFYLLSPVHPARGLLFNLSILSSIINLYYHYTKELDDVLTQDDSEMGQTV